MGYFTPFPNKFQASVQIQGWVQMVAGSDKLFGNFLVPNKGFVANSKVRSNFLGVGIFFQTKATFFAKTQIERNFGKCWPPVTLNLMFAEDIPLVRHI